MWHDEKIIPDKRGKTWHLRIWWSLHGRPEAQRIFFWDDAKAVTGFVEFAGDKALDFSRLKQRMTKLAKDPEYRGKHARPLEFPLERNY